MASTNFIDGQTPILASWLNDVDALVYSGGTGTVAWGAILGTLSSQTDLVAALATKAPVTSGNALLYGNGSGGFSNVTIGANLTFSAGTLSATGGGGMVYPSAGIGNSTGSAWGTSYTVTGTGTVLVAATSPTLVTPVLGTPTSGNLSSCTADGTSPVGFRNIPQNSQSAAYTCVLEDAGKHIFHPSADTTARIYTIPANSSVAYIVGTAITFINQNAAGVITIAITTDTMRLAGAGTTGSRTLAANGVATAIKVTATEWIISGTGLT